MSVNFEFGGGNENDNRFPPILLTAEQHDKVRKERRVNPFDVRLEKLRYALSMYRDKYPSNPDSIASRSSGAKGLRRDSIQFPTPSGYFRSCDPIWMKFLVNFTSELYHEFGVHEPRLLVNHAAQTEWATHIHNDTEIHVEAKDLNLTESYIRVWHNFTRNLLLRADVNNLKLYAHRDTTPGPNKRMGDGSFYSRKDVEYDAVSTEQLSDSLRYLHSSDNVVPLSENKFRKDYFKVKESWFPLFKEIFEKQLEVADVGIDNLSFEKIINCIHGGVITSSKGGFRFNSTDKPINIEPGELLKPEKTLYCKDRAGAQVTNFGMLNFKIDAALYSKFYNDEVNALYRFAVNRTREINNAAYEAQFSSQVSSRMLMTEVENSMYGFAADRPEIQLRYKNYLEKCKNIIGSGVFTFINADRENAETFITSHHELYLQLTLPELRNWDRLVSTVVQHGKIPYAVCGCLSGIGKTTEKNWIAGHHEMCNLLSRICNVEISKVLELWIDHYEKGEPGFQVGNYYVYNSMPTDDIPLVIYGPALSNELSASVVSEAKKRRMEVEISNEGFVTFGQKFDLNEMKVHLPSVYSKLFFFEHRGFYAKDCFTFFCRMNLLSEEERKFTETRLLKYLKLDPKEIYSAGQAYPRFLKELGLPMDSQFDPYSPIGKLVLGKYVDPDTMFESARVPVEYFEPIVKRIQNLIKR